MLKKIVHFCSTFFSRSNRRWGTCQQVQKCSNANEIFWPPTGRCYMRHAKGPCSIGQLITLGPEDLGVCKCNHRYEMKEYWSEGNGCFQHFTRGPCKEKGHIFLPDRSCGCHEFLPHFHNETQQCFEIGVYYTVLQFL